VPDRSLLRRTTLSHEIREALIARIVSGDLAPGTRLVETRLAAEFGTSQSPVREALRDLEAIRLVEKQPNRGTFVCGFAEQTLRESYVVRAALEEAATRIVLLAGALPVAGLHEDVDRMARAAALGDAEACARASVSFHRRIVAAAHNDLLLQSWEGLWIDARTTATIVAAGLDLHEVAVEHERLLGVLAEQDVETACRATREHQGHYAGLRHDAAGWGI
jgi:DNA-binding GntR family transcriptional regulator